MQAQSRFFFLLLRRNTLSAHIRSRRTSGRQKNLMDHVCLKHVCVSQCEQDWMEWKDEASCRVCVCAAYVGACVRDEHHSNGRMNIKTGWASAPHYLWGSCVCVWVWRMGEGGHDVTMCCQDICACTPGRLLWFIICALSCTYIREVVKCDLSCAEDDKCRAKWFWIFVLCVID